MNEILDRAVEMLEEWCEAEHFWGGAHGMQSFIGLVGEGFVLLVPRYGDWDLPAGLCVVSDWLETQGYPVREEEFGWPEIGELPGRVVTYPNGVVTVVRRK